MPILLVLSHQLVLNAVLVGLALVASELEGLGGLGNLGASLRDKLLVFTEDHLFAREERALFGSLAPVVLGYCLPALGAALFL
jgi:hypothetical protein